MEFRFVVKVSQANMLIIVRDSLEFVLVISKLQYLGFVMENHRKGSNPTVLNFIALFHCPGMYPELSNC